MNNKYQILTIVHSHFSTRIVPEAVVYNDMKDAIRQIYKLVETFTERGELITYCGKVNNTDKIFDIYSKVSTGEYCEVYLYELEEK